MAARALDLPGIGVLSGGLPARTLRDAGAAAIYEDAAALARDLDRALARPGEERRSPR